MKNFTLCGVQRSGTNFLAKSLNDCSNVWDIEPENFTYFSRYADSMHYTGDFIPQDVNYYAFKVNQYLDYKGVYYGKVCPQFTYCMHDITANKKAFLIRNIDDYLISMCNHWNERNNDDTQKRVMIRYFSYIYEYIYYHVKNNGIKVFRFEDYTTSIGAIENIIDFVGIKDADINKINLNNKVNSMEDRKQPKKYHAITQIFTRKEIEYINKFRYIEDFLYI